MTPKEIEEAARIREAMKTRIPMRLLKLATVGELRELVDTWEMQATLTMLRQRHGSGPELRTTAHVPTESLAAQQARRAGRTVETAEERHARERQGQQDRNARNTARESSLRHFAPSPGSLREQLRRGNNNPEGGNAA